jgi:hypothetical protein
MSVLSSKPTLIEWGSVRFLIMDKPKDSNLHLYLKECKKHNVTDIVRICEPCYDAAEVEKSGIHLHVSGFPRIGAAGELTRTQPLRIHDKALTFLFLCLDALSFTPLPPPFPFLMPIMIHVPTTIYFILFCARDLLFT